MGRKLQNKKKYIGFLAIVMVLSLSILGVGYAHLNDETKLDVTINMADFKQDIDFTFLPRTAGGTVIPATLTGKDDASVNVNCETKLFLGPFDLQFKITNPEDSGIPIKYHLEVRSCDPGLIIQAHTLYTKRYLENGDNSITNNIPIIVLGGARSYNFQLALIIEQFNEAGWEREILINGYLDVGKWL